MRTSDGSIRRSGSWVTFRITQMAAYLGKKAKISIGNHDLLWASLPSVLGIRLKTCSGITSWLYIYFLE